MCNTELIFGLLSVVIGYHRSQNGHVITLHVSQFAITCIAHLVLAKQMLIFELRSLKVLP